MIEKIRSLWTKHRLVAVIVLVSAGVALVGVPAGFALVSATRTIPTATAIPTAAAIPTPKAPTPTPTPVDVQLSAGEWVAVDRVLVSSEEGVAAAERVVNVFAPGRGESSIKLAPLFDGQELLDARWVIAGVDDVTLVIASRIRTPADGLTPESFTLELVAVDLDGRVLNRTFVATGASSSLTFGQVVGSRSNIVAVSVNGPGEEASVKGIDFRTGETSWTAVGYAVAPTFGTVTVFSDLAGLTREGRPCELVTGYDVATGRALWAVDSTTEELDEGRCRGLYIYASAGWATSYENSAVQGAMVSVQVGNPYTGGEVGTKVFEAATGKPLTMLSDRVDLYDPVKHLAYLDDSPSAWVGDRYGEPVSVYDTYTGSKLFELDTETANQLEFDADQLFNGLLYGETTDGRVVIDTSTGDVIAKEWTYYPLARVGDWTFYSDGTLSLDPRKIG